MNSISNALAQLRRTVGRLLRALADHVDRIDDENREYRERDR